MPSQLSQFWSALAPRQKVALVAVGVFTFAGLGLVAFWASRPNYQVLYTGLSPEDAGRVLEHLKKNNIPYRLSGAGGVIEVPSERVYEARLDLAMQGVPSGGGVGFEIFDRSALPGTEFTNSVNYQRALQGELARTIAQLNQVVAARVHLTLPQPRLYSTDTSPPTASVVLELRPGFRLSTEQVQGIAHLVASAVEGLEPENVTIVDSTGNTLAAGGAGPRAPGALATAQLAVGDGFERALQTRIQQMLDAALGQAKSIVTVRAELNFDSQQMTKERYEPTGADRGFVSRGQTSRQEYQGAGGGPAGAPGMDANVLGPAPTGLQHASAGRFSSSDKTVEYQFSKTVETLMKAPGQIKRLSVAAIVDESVPSAQVSAVRDLIEAAAGIDINRGDTLRVETMKLAAAQADKESLDAERRAFAADRRWRLILTLARYIAIALAGLLIFKASDSILARIQAVATQAAPLKPSAPVAEEHTPAAIPPASGPLDREQASAQTPALPQDFQYDPVAVANKLAMWLSGSDHTESAHQ